MIEEGRWQGTHDAFYSPRCLMSPRSNTKIVGGTGDQRVTTDDCTRFWMSCTTQTKWMAPFKMTSEISKEVSVVIVCAFRLEHYFPVAPVLLLQSEKEMWKMISHHSDFFSICFFPKRSTNFIYGYWNKIETVYSHSQKSLWDTRKFLWSADFYQEKIDKFCIIHYKHCILRERVIMGQLIYF